MKFLKVILPGLLLLTILVWYLPHSIFADTSSDLQAKEDQIKDLQNKVNSLQSQEKTLNFQITDMNNKMKLTELKISTTKDLIAQLQGDITLLSGKVDSLESKLADVSNILLNRVVVAYKIDSTDPTNLLLADTGFSDYVNRAQYIKIAQEHDRELLFELEQTKQNYNNQKEVFTQKQQEQQDLQAQLVKLSNDLDQQRLDKQRLLSVTRNDESKYQQLLNAALAERDAMAQALSTPLVDGKEVKKGDVIGVIGNSGAPGCSTGAHLHFEVRINKEIKNPADYLKKTDVGWDNSPDGQFSFNGDLDWPIESPRITQGYGMTYWARTGFYGGGPHTGIDMISGSSSLIKAPKDGTAYRGSTDCKGSQMNYIAIDHGNGFFTWYWHVK